MSSTAQLGTAGTWLIAPDLTFPDLDREGKATLCTLSDFSSKQSVNRQEPCYSRSALETN